jgi:hypothetical protein
VGTVSGPDCVICNHVPAADVSFWRHAGLIVVVRWHRLRGPYCRGCGTAVFRDATARTMTTGWWSIISWLLAPLALLLNLRSARAVARLATPTPHPAATPDRRPLDPTRPVFRRPGPWLGPAALAALVVALATVDVPPPRQYDVVGGCVRFVRVAWAEEALFVDCAESHHAVITAVADHWDACPGEYVATGYRFYCLAPR